MLEMDSPFTQLLARLEGETPKLSVTQSKFTGGDYLTTLWA